MKFLNLSPVISSVVHEFPLSFNKEVVLGKHHPSHMMCCSKDNCEFK